MLRRMVRKTGRFACACACFVGTLSATALAQAQVSAEEKATAEAVFEEGIRLIKQGNFAEACPKFEMSQRVEPAVGTMLYLAECYEKTNRTASSWAMFREAASLAETSGQTERMKTAQARAARLEPRLAWLTIEVAKDALVPGLQIRRNSVPVSSEFSGTSSPVDPGEVLVEASAPGRLPYSTKVKIAAKARAVATIPVLQAAPDAVSSAAQAPPTQEPGVQPSPVAAAGAAAAGSEAPAGPAPAQRSSPVPWLVGGAGVVALGVGSYFGFRAISKANDAEELCPKGICNSSEGTAAADDAHTAATISNVSLVLGAAAVATGVVLFLVLPTKQGTQVGLLPMIEPSTLGLSVRGRLEL